MVANFVTFDCYLFYMANLASCVTHMRVIFMSNTHVLANTAFNMCDTCVPFSCQIHVSSHVLHMCGKVDSVVFLRKILSFMIIDFSIHDRSKSQWCYSFCFLM